MPDPILVITILSLLAVAFALSRAYRHGSKLNRLLQHQAPSSQQERDG